MAAQASTNDIKPGFKLEIENAPYLVVSNEFVKPGKGQAFNRIKLKHLLTGRVIERTYKSGEKLDLADVEEVKMRLLYREGDGVVFMQDDTFEQVKVSNDNLADTEQWLMEDTLYDIMFYKGLPVSVEPPTFMEMEITESSSGIRGDTSGRVMKSAVTSTGAKIQVPIFIEQGEIVKIDTRTGEYVSRSTGA